MSCIVTATGIRAKLWKWVVLREVHGLQGQRSEGAYRGKQKEKSDFCIKASAELFSALTLSMILSTILGKSLEPNYSYAVINYVLLIIWVSHLRQNWKGVELSPLPFTVLRAMLWISNVLNVLKKCLTLANKNVQEVFILISFVPLSSKSKMNVWVPFGTERFWKYVHFYFCSYWMLMWIVWKVWEKI